MPNEDCRKCQFREFEPRDRISKPKTKPLDGTNIDFSWNNFELSGKKSLVITLIPFARTLIALPQIMMSLSHAQKLDRDPIILKWRSGPLSRFGLWKRRMSFPGQIQFFAPFLNLDGSFGGSNISSELSKSWKKPLLSPGNTNYVNFWQFRLNFNERHSKFKSELSRANNSNRENGHVAVLKNALKSYEKILTGRHQCVLVLGREKTQFWTTMASYFQKDFPFFRGKNKNLDGLQHIHHVSSAFLLSGSHAICSQPSFYDRVLDAR